MDNERLIKYTTFSVKRAVLTKMIKLILTVRIIFLMHMKKTRDELLSIYNIKTTSDVHAKAILEWKTSKQGIHSGWVEAQQNIERWNYRDEPKLKKDILVPIDLSGMSMEQIIKQISDRWPSSTYTSKRYLGKLMRTATIIGRLDIFDKFYLSSGPGITHKIIQLVTKYDLQDVSDWLVKNKLSSSIILS